MVRLPCWLSVAMGEIGVVERPGDEHNSRILEYHSHASLKAQRDERPWCSSFCCWVFAQVDMEHTGTALARSWLSWGEGLERPRPGCVYVMRRGTQSWQGHVGFWLGYDGAYEIVLGGNQNNRVTVSRYPRSKTLGYRWPVGYRLR